MSEIAIVDSSMSDRDLVRTLRVSASRCGEYLPESLLWQTFHELRRRGHAGIDTMFITGLRSLHRRRSVAGSDLSIHDTWTEEHRMADDEVLSELWKAYKKCIRTNRNGPAGQLLQEIEDRLVS